jgi:hypothetical protein
MMRFVPSVTTVSKSTNPREVKGLSATYAVKPVHPREPVAPTVTLHHEAAPQIEQQHHREAPLEDRRKACRRVSHLPVLVELRSGVERRHHNLRGDDLVDHIDETA